MKKNAGCKYIHTEKVKVIYIHMIREKNMPKCSVAG